MRKVPRPKEARAGNANGVKQNKGGGAGQTNSAKTQGTKGQNTQSIRQKRRRTGKGKKPKNKQKREGNPSPEGAKRTRRAPRTATGNVTRIRTRPGGQAAWPGQGQQAHTQTHGTRPWHPPTQKGRCQCPSKTAPLHQLSASSKGGRHGKVDA